MPSDTSDRSLGDLVVHLTQQMSSLVRQEIALAQAEMRQNTADIRRDFMLMAVGGAIAFAGIISLLTTGIIMLAQVWPWWASLLTIGGSSTVIGFVVSIIGQVALGRARLIPRKTLSNLVHPSKEATA